MLCQFSRKSMLLSSLCIELFLTMMVSHNSITLVHLKKIWSMSSFWEQRIFFFVIHALDEGFDFVGTRHIPNPVKLLNSLIWHGVSGFWVDKLIGTIGGNLNITVEDIESSRDLKRQFLFNLCPGHVEIAFKII